MWRKKAQASPVQIFRRVIAIPAPKLTRVVVRLQVAVQHRFVYASVAALQRTQRSRIALVFMHDRVQRDFYFDIRRRRLLFMKREEPKQRKKQYIHSGKQTRGGRIEALRVAALIVHYQTSINELFSVCALTLSRFSMRANSLSTLIVGKDRGLIAYQRFYAAAPDLFNLFTGKFLVI